MTFSRLVLLMATVVLSASACVRLPTGPEPGQFQAALPPMPEPPLASPGAIYQPGHDLRLFDDPKARRVGDVLTIRLVERTAASKSASTDSSKTTAITNSSPNLAGSPLSAGGNPLLEVGVDGSNSFSGSGSSSQSNQLDGLITVTVAGVYPNGNMAIRGEKWITLNQGQEYVNITGIVRPQDVLPDNTVVSNRVADARITYSGKGSVANANKPGWLARFFMSPLWPM